MVFSVIAGILSRLIKFSPSIGYSFRSQRTYSELRRGLGTMVNPVLHGVAKRSRSPRTRRHHAVCNRPGADIGEESGAEMGLKAEQRTSAGFQEKPEVIFLFVQGVGTQQHWVLTTQFLPFLDKTVWHFRMEFLRFISERHRNDCALSFLPPLRYIM